MKRACVDSNDYRTCLLGKRSRKQGSAKPVFNDPPLLHPHGVKLKASKVIHMTKLMQFVPPINQQYYQDVIRNHKKIVDRQKKVGRRKIRKITSQSQTKKQKNYFNLIYSPTKIYFGQKSRRFVPLVVIMFKL